MKKKITQEELKTQVHGLAQLVKGIKEFASSFQPAESQWQRLNQELEIHLLHHQLAEINAKIQRKTQTAEPQPKQNKEPESKADRP